MSFDWSTFVLEILNFLALLWLLKRLFYAPVLAALDARRQQVEAANQQAADAQRSAEALQTQYAQRLADWEQHCAAQRIQLDAELAEARAAGLAELQQSLADAALKAEARNAALAAAHEAHLARRATQHAYSDATALLTRLADAALTERIAALLLEDLATLPESERAALQQAAAALNHHARIDLASAHPLNAASVAAIEQALNTVIGIHLPIQCRVEPALLAGLRIDIGERRLHLNLSDELAFFQQQALHG